jgi:hypothetical protein
VSRTAPSVLVRTVPVVAVAALLLAGCGSGGSTTAAGASSSSSSKAAASGSARRGRPPGGALGLAGPIASIGKGTFTLTASTGRATVDYTPSTTFTKTTAGALADVRTGVCVAVTEAAGSDASTGSVDASVVRISPSVKGSCTPGAGAGVRGPGGFGGGLGGGDFGGGGQRPSGAPGGGTAPRALLAGIVTSTNTTGFVVTVDAANAAAGSAAGTTMAVAVSSATTYSVTTPVPPSSLTVGECARVFSGFRGRRASGSAAPSTTAPGGPVTAASVTLSPPMNGGCPDLTRRPAGAGADSSAGATDGA